MPSPRARGTAALLTAPLPLALLVGVASGALPRPAAAEVIELIDKTKMAAKIVHYYDGVYSVETGGQVVKVPREKIRAITFSLPPARAEFSTPEKTFERWRKSMADGDVDKMIDCYALMNQGFLAFQMSQTPDALRKMQKELEGVKFAVKSAAQKGEVATLKVERRKGDDSEVGDVIMVRENGEWKMVLPQGGPGAP